MWVPRDAAEIEAAAKRGDLEETASFDAKADLPVPKKNNSLAVDVAAMSTDGGVLLYGVAEDQNKRPTVPEPITLPGAADRIDQIVSTSISEVPYIDVREYPTNADPSKGYIVVIVPQSARAPHQVTVGGDLRYYGRAAKGNRILTEADVARLYQRREQWQQNRSVLLGEAVGQAPFPPNPEFIYLHGFTRPVAPDRAIWERAESSAGGRDGLQRTLGEAAAKVAPRAGYSPDLRSGVYWTRQGADEWRLSSTYETDYSDPSLANYLVNVRMNIDGRGHLFCGRAGAAISRNVMPPQPDVLILFEQIVAGNLAGFLAAMGALYRLAGYHGHVDLGFAVTGLRGALSNTLLERQVGFLHQEQGYEGDVYPRDDRVAAAVLEDPRDLVRQLLQQLFEATTSRDDYDPF